MVIVFYDPTSWNFVSMSICVIDIKNVILSVNITGCQILYLDTHIDQPLKYHTVIKMNFKYFE